MKWVGHWVYSKYMILNSKYMICLLFFSLGKIIFKDSRLNYRIFFYSTSIRSLSSPALIGSCAIPSTWSTMSGGISISCSLIICWTGSWLKLFDLTHWKSTWRDLCSSFSQDNETNGLKIIQICFLATIFFSYRNILNLLTVVQSCKKHVICLFCV